MLSEWAVDVDKPSRSSVPADSVTRVQVTDEGPVLVDGPVEITLQDGTTVRSDRMQVAVCGCRKSKRYPFCDTSHRCRVRTDRDQSGA